jgi:hypothetical protein
MNKFFGILFFGIFFSCSSDLDFSQATEAKLEPIVVSNFAAFDVSANKFVIGGVEQSVLVDVLDYDIFRDTFFKKSLVKADLFFEINNTINRDYIVNLNFLDINNTKLFTIPFDVPAYTGVQNLVTKTEIFEKSKLDSLKQTKKIEFVITMLPGPLLNASSLGSLKMRSSSTVYLML